ncbi:unnamed protein product [Lampetra fluviatilis]
MRPAAVAAAGTWIGGPGTGAGHAESGDESVRLEKQGAIWVCDASPSVEATLREAHGHLVEFLHAAASLLSPTLSPVKEGAAMPLLDDDSAAASQQDGNSVAQPSYSAAILSLAWSAQPAKLKDVTSASFIKEFAATSGDWGVAFKRRFFMNADLAGWTEAEALWALPAALDDDTLVAFLTIPPLERSTLTQAFDQMMYIYSY